MSLTNKACENAEPREKPYKRADGQGLYLEIMPNGAKYWRLKYRFVGTEKRLALGVYPEVNWYDQRGHQVMSLSVSVKNTGSWCIVCPTLNNLDPQNGRSIEIQLTHSACNYGGQRVWFLCPYCNRRAAIIYASVDIWACRACLQLCYTSQCEGQLNRLERLQAKAERQYKIAVRRKGVHQTTLDRLWQAFVSADMAWEDGYMKLARQFG